MKLFGRPPQRPREPLPIAILSFDRPTYLRSTLLSLRRQTTPADPVLLFQDGAFNPHSGRLKGDQTRIEACVALFREIFPWGEVFQAPENLGIADNYQRAETHVFVQRDAAAALFLEDDLVLSRHYLGAVDRLIGFALADPRIAYVSAYGDMWARRIAQWRDRRRLIHMHENWGAATTRRAWQDEQPFRRRYLALLEGADYSDRDHERIRAFFREHGLDTRITSQDAARWLATVLLGKVRLTTAACYARYIGRFGEHATPDYYRAGGFAGTRTALWPPADIEPPSDEEIAQWLAAERERFTGAFTPFYSGHSE
ncbi:glycosyltransferase family A protein [Rhodoplanes roseus]|uniref:Glycosyl transferase n=1 Tax=Rhodoplanes roseus TaxID=29409 RepID=A0A327L414_9BRAD|nr:glycosyltransferase family A protein [Rhodoplanes roseus]RAI45147.1 hypothetical protein CH341_05480 [Rhodoplanes roseus]